MDIFIRKEGQAGRATLSRPKSLNALTKQMSIDLESALDTWRDDPAVKLIILDAEGDKAFCAGGDIADLYTQGMKGAFTYGHEFWRQEYRLNLKIANYPKPIVSFMQGFIMGGGVGVGCHGSHRIVDENSKIAMPECRIGLIPDVGGTYLLANAPQGLGVLLGMTGMRMTSTDAIFSGFADYEISQNKWSDLIPELVETGQTESIFPMRNSIQDSPLAKEMADILHAFEASSVTGIMAILEAHDTEASKKVIKGLKSGSPLSLACTLEMIHRAKDMNLAEALAQEFRFSYRAQEDSDFLEGIRAQIIDKDFAPSWRHKTLDVPQSDVNHMLASLDAAEWAG